MSRLTEHLLNEVTFVNSDIEAITNEFRNFKVSISPDGSIHIEDKTQHGNVLVIITKTNKGIKSKTVIEYNEEYKLQPLDHTLSDIKSKIDRFGWY